MVADAAHHTPGIRPLPTIPVLEVGADFPMATLRADEPRAHALLDQATQGIPRAALQAADAVSRRWLIKSRNSHLPEIDDIAARLDRPGAYFLSVNYEWGCTVGVKPCPDRQTARLVRVLDWRTPGLGRNIMAATVNGAAGRFLTLTWPGYTGVLQGMAPGRFSAALNQAPMRKSAGGFLPIDWAVNRMRVWRMPYPTPAHLLRTVFETCRSFADAKRVLMDHPIASPGIYSLAGLTCDETCVIERTETKAHLHEGPSVAANHWQAAGWTGHPRGKDSAGRTRLMHTIPSALDLDFSWVKPPILNERTRLAMVADASSGHVVAQGFEADGPATLPLELKLQAAS